MGVQSCGQPFARSTANSPRQSPARMRDFDGRSQCDVTGGKQQLQRTVGTGGRNQQFALYAATLLRPEDDPVAILSAGSDGIDGNSPAAGAVVDRELVAGNELPLPGTRWSQFDAFPFLSDHGKAIVIGPSGNNLRDLRILVAEPPQTLVAPTSWRGNSINHIFRFRIVESNRPEFKALPAGKVVSSLNQGPLARQGRCHVTNRSKKQPAKARRAPNGIAGDSKVR